jgi:ribonuclease HII
LVNLYNTALSESPNNLRHEKRIRQQGFKKIAGVDEAGCGPLAGPVVAAAVILPAEYYDKGIQDSKKMSAKKRENFFREITENALGYGVGIVDQMEIDRLNIRQATLKAMRQALGRLKLSPDYVLFDGYELPEKILKQEAIVKGDNFSFTIASASIIAKVLRDRMMLEYHEQYPQYGFDHHKGYGTQLHRDMIKKYGPCLLHRRTFLKKILPDI